MFKILYNIFIECRRYILNGLPKKEINRNKKGDITKYFDKYIEKLIIFMLKKKCKLKAKVLSEELGKTIEINKNFPGNYNYIIIDPVDGSDNYVASIPFVCMGLSFFDDKKNPTYSFVGNYYSGDWIYADKKKILSNKKYYKKKDNNKKMLIFTFSKSRLKTNVRNIFNDFDIIRSLGATIGEMILVAKGCAEAFVDIRGKLTLENFAPFFLISRHFGLRLTDEQGNDIILNNYSITKKYKIIFAKPKILRNLLKII